jgi:hypothetical protein
VAGGDGSRPALAGPHRSPTERPEHCLPSTGCRSGLHPGCLRDGEAQWIGRRSIRETVIAGPNGCLATSRGCRDPCPRAG